MFSLTPQLKSIQASAVTVIGINFIAAFSFFSLCIYFYKVESKNFLINTYYMKNSFPLTHINFIVFPILEVLIHVYYYNYPQSQLLTLSTLKVIEFAIIFIF